VLVLMMFTCGIYPLIWIYKTCNEMKAFLQRDEPQWWMLIFIPFYAVYWLALKAGPLVQEVQQRAGVANATNHGFVYIIPVYGTFLLQSELNRAWSSPG
jgi:hypothetical protein